MQVAVETTEGLERRMTVDLPEERLASEIDSRLQNMAGNVRVPGFRPGKVPMKVLAKRFGRQVRDEVVGEMLRASFIDAVEGEKLRPAGGPTIDPISAEPGKGLTYTAVFEVYPDIALGPLSELELSRPVATVEPDDVEKMFRVLRRQRREWLAVERAAATGDRVTIDFIGKIDGEEFEGGKGSGVPIEIGSGRMVPGFEDGLVGISAGGERELELTFPLDYPSESVAGKAATFEVKAQAVEEVKLPEIDEEFIKAFGVQDGSPESFRTEVQANMERELANTLRAQTKQRVMDALLERNPVEVPRTLIGEESERLLAQRRQELANAGIDPARISLTADAFEAESRRRVQLGLLLAEVIKAGNLRADPLRVREEVERIAGSYEDPSAVINWFYGEPARLQEIESQMLEEAAVESVLKQAQVTNETLSFDALLNPGQTSPEGS